jgi:hypothetical protein
MRKDVFALRSNWLVCDNWALMTFRRAGQNSSVSTLNEDAPLVPPASRLCKDTIPSPERPDPSLADNVAT